MNTHVNLIKWLAANNYCLVQGGFLQHNGTKLSAQQAVSRYYGAQLSQRKFSALSLPEKVTYFEQVFIKAGAPRDFLTRQSRRTEYLAPRFVLTALLVCTYKHSLNSLVGIAGNGNHTSVRHRVITTLNLQDTRSNNHIKQFLHELGITIPRPHAYLHA